jgi:hypothetical protein
MSQVGSSVVRALIHSVWWREGSGVSTNTAVCDHRLLVRGDGRAAVASAPMLSTSLLLCGIGAETEQQVSFPLATDKQGNTFKAQGFAVLLGDPHNDEGDQLGLALYKREDLAWAAAQAHLQVDVLADSSVSGQRCDAHTHTHTHGHHRLYDTGLVVVWVVEV